MQKGAYMIIIKKIKWVFEGTDFEDCDYEESRKIVQKFLNAKSLEEIIFTSGGTDSVNLVASSYADEHLSKGDEIIINLLLSSVFI